MGLKFRDLSDAGVALWIFLIVGAIIILLQLVPAVILFFNLVGTGTHAALADPNKVMGSCKSEPMTATIPLSQSEFDERRNESI